MDGISFEQEGATTITSTAQSLVLLPCPIQKGTYQKERLTAFLKEQVLNKTK